MNKTTEVLVSITQTIYRSRYPQGRGDRQVFQDLLVEVNDNLVHVGTLSDLVDAQDELYRRYGLAVRA